MRYMIYCSLKGNVEDYQHSLVNKIAEKFNLVQTKEKNLATHFTIKYSFETNSIKEIEKISEDFCKIHKKKPVKVGGFDGFSPKIIFIKVNLSEDAKKMFFEYVSELRKIKWMSWDDYDAENLNFHSTIAEECDEKYDSVWKFVQGKEKYFNCWFDNITLLKLIRGDKFSGKWVVHKTYEIK